MTATSSDARQKLVECLNQLKLRQPQLKVLEFVSLDDYGFQLSAAPSIIGASINCPIEDCSQAITELTAADLLITVSINSHVRLVANYSKIGLSEEERQALRQAQPTPFEVLDAPHSAEAMATLHALFLDETKPIYVGLDLTSHRVFERLTDRANSGRMTVFVMPHQCIVPTEHQAHYDEILSNWIRFISDLPASARQSVRLRRSKRSYRYLHTSTLTSEYVRFNCYWYDKGTTRSGTMVKALKGSSLYEIVYREYAEAVDSAFPLFSLWPLEWTQQLIRRFAPAIFTGVLLILACMLDQLAGIGFKPAAYLATFFAGLAGEGVWEFCRNKLHTVPALYGN